VDEPAMCGINLARCLVSVLGGEGIAQVIDRAPVGVRTPTDVAPHLAHLRGEAQAAAELFILGRVVSLDEFGSEARDAIGDLSALGLARVKSGSAQLVDVVLTRQERLWLMVSPPSPYETPYYFGEDSVGLALRLEADEGDSCLDLCAGVGLQALVLASMGGVVDAVEIDPAAALVGRLNAGINGLQSSVAFHVDDLFAPVPGRSYDVIAANIPFLPGIQTGRDGFGVGREILRALSGHLHASGQAWMTGLVLVTSAGDVLLPDGLHSLAATSRRRVHVECASTWEINRHSDFVAAVTDQDPTAESDYESALTAVAQYYENHDVVAARNVFIHVGSVRAHGARGEVHVRG
jgi:hypothetical protein